MKTWRETLKSTVPENPEPLRLPLTVIGSLGTGISLLSGISLIKNYNRSLGDIRLHTEDINYLDIYIEELIGSTSRMVNAVFLLGSPHETVSGRSWRLRDKNGWAQSRYVIDFLLYPYEKNHCQLGYLSDLSKAKRFSKGFVSPYSEQTNKRIDTNKKFVWVRKKEKGRPSKWFPMF